MIRIYSCLFFLLLFSCSQDNPLKQVIHLHHYPSASGIEYVNGQAYMIGDDAAYMLILDDKLKPKDSIELYSFHKNRIAKAIKPDLEAVAVVSNNNLLLLGSGSLAPHRNIAWLVNPVTKQKDSIRLDTFYQRLHEYGINEINMEGACAIPGSFIMANRGSKGYPKNHLLLTSSTFWQAQQQAPISSILVGSNTDSTVFNGVSGMTYAPKSDRLLLTVSTEDTRNSLDDGAIGKSYLWIIENMSGKKKWKAINPDKVIDLEKLDDRFNRQKIESVCVIKETNRFLHLLLVADNDNGSSTLFKVVVQKD